MRSWLNLLLVLGLCALAPGCCLFRRVIRRPRVERVRPRIAGIDFQGVDLAFRIDLRNPNAVPLWAPPARYALDVQGRELLRGETGEGCGLPAREAATLTLPVRVAYADLWRAYLDLRDVPEATYRLRGTLLFTALGQTVGVPLSHSGTFPVLRAPSFTGVRFRVGDLSLGGATVTVDADVRNANVFEVEVKDLGYTFQLGEARVAGLTVSAAEPIPAGGTGHVTLTGRLSAAGAALGLLRREARREPKLVPSGFLKTPYGTVRLPPRDESGPPSR